jgi:hypothetical protein
VRTLLLIAAVCTAGPLGAATVVADAPPDLVAQLMPPGLSDKPLLRSADMSGGHGKTARHDWAWKTGPVYAPGLILNRRAERSPAFLPEIAKAVLGIISAGTSSDAQGASAMVLTMDGAGAQRIVRIAFTSGARSPLRVASLPDDLPRFVRAASAPSGRLPTDATLP